MHEGKEQLKENAEFELTAVDNARLTDTFL